MLSVYVELLNSRSWAKGRLQCKRMGADNISITCFRNMRGDSPHSLRLPSGERRIDIIWTDIWVISAPLILAIFVQSRKPYPSVALTTRKFLTLHSSISPISAITSGIRGSGAETNIIPRVTGLNPA